jgi:tetratricopeptide (TPR) repeat protein
LVARADLNRDEAPGKAKSDMDRASDTLENLVTDFPATPEYRQQQAALLVSLANFHLAQGDPAQAEATLDRALSVREDLTRRVPWVPEYDRQLAGTLNDRGLLFQTARRLDRAEKSYLESEKKLRALVAAHPGASDYRQELAKTLLNLAALRIQQKQPQTAGPLSDEAISLLAGLVERFPQEPARRVELARGMANAAVNAQLAGTPAKAIELDQKALEALAGARRQEDSADISYLMATTGSHLADLIDERDGISKALPVYEAALSELRNLARSAASRPEFVRRLVEELNEIGFRLARAESLEKARALWLESLEVMRSRKETDPADNLADPASRLAANLTAMAQLEHGKGRFDDAHALLGKALELRRDRLPSHPSAAVGALELARAELLESAWREERNKKREALAAVLRASVHAARGLSSSAEADAAVKAGLAQAAGECAKALATAKDNPESQGRLSSLARAALDGGNRQASLSIIESAMNAGRLDDGWEWLTLLDKAGFTDAAWMRRVIATDPPAGPRRELRERWLKNQ